MADNQRIEDLRRRVHKDPSSIAFAQLAEECRRAGQYAEAVEVCRAGLAIHPGYLSARVTLGRALIELNQLAVAQEELDFVLKGAPENLAAIRGLAEIHQRNGSLADALKHYRAALVLARNDPDLQQTVAELERAVEPPKPKPSEEGLSFEQMQSEFLEHLPPPPKPPPPPAPIEPPEPAAPVAMDSSEPAAIVVDSAEHEEPATELSAPTHVWDAPEPPVPAMDLSESTAFAIDSSEPMAFALDPAAAERPMDWFEPIPPTLNWPAPEAAAMDETATTSSATDTIERDSALRTIAALEQWLDAIHVARAQPGA